MVRLQVQREKSSIFFVSNAVLPSHAAYQPRPITSILPPRRRPAAAAVFFGAAAAAAAAFCRHSAHPTRTLLEESSFSLVEEKQQQHRLHALNSFRQSEENFHFLFRLSS